MQTSTVQRIEATITRFGKVQQSKYPPYERIQSVLFTCQTDQGEQTHWKTFPAEDARLLKVGQPASLYNRAGLGDRPLWEVEFNATPQPVTKQIAPWSSAVSLRPESPVMESAYLANSEQEIQDWIDDKAALYAYCFGAATQALTDYPVGEETLHAAASTLFIAAKSRFKLESA